MNARTTFPELPLDGEIFAPCAQYRRLFGLTRPDMAITMPSCSNAVGHGNAIAPNSLPDDGALGPPHPFPCDPKAAAGHLSIPGQSLADIAALRARHLAKGHTPESDAAHGWVHFKRLSDQAYSAAIAARSAAARRERLIIAAAILIAQIDAEDFLAQQQEPTPCDQ